MQSHQNCIFFFFLRILVPVKVQPTGLGGSMNIVFGCNGCEMRSITFQGSMQVGGSKRTVVGLALAVALIIVAMDLQSSIKP